MRTLHGKEMRAIRRRKGLTQAEFWQRVGITQSGGCRYERESRRISKPVQLCLLIAFGTIKEARAAVLHMKPRRWG